MVLDQFNPFLGLSSKNSCDIRMFLGEINVLYSRIVLLFSLLASSPLFVCSFWACFLALSRLLQCTFPCPFCATFLPHSPLSALIVIVKRLFFFTTELSFLLFFLSCIFSIQFHPPCCLGLPFLLFILKPDTLWSGHDLIFVFDQVVSFGDLHLRLRHHSLLLFLLQDLINLIF